MAERPADNGVLRAERYDMFVNGGRVFSNVVSETPNHTDEIIRPLA